MFSTRNLTIGILALAAALAAAAALMAFKRGGPGEIRDPRFASPEAVLNAYIKAVLEVDVRGEAECAVPELRKKMDLVRGTDPERRKALLEAKSKVFQATPVSSPVAVKVWGKLAKIMVTQGGPPSNPIPYVYTFTRSPEGWKISMIEQTADMKW